MIISGYKQPFSSLIVNHLPQSMSVPVHDELTQTKVHDTAVAGHVNVVVFSVLMISIPGLV